MSYTLLTCNKLTIILVLIVDELIMIKTCLIYEGQDELRHPKGYGRCVRKFMGGATKKKKKKNYGRAMDT